jgi:uncharacterized protein
VAERVPIFPLHSILLPHTDLGLHVFEERYRSLVGHCLDSGEGFGVVLIRRGREVGGPAEPHSVGTMARIAGYARLPDGRYLLEVEGYRRFRIVDIDCSNEYPAAWVEHLPEAIGDFGVAREHSEEAEKLLASYRLRNGDGDVPLKLPVDPVARSYTIATMLAIDPPEKQTLLETETADVRLAREVSILRREMALLDHIGSERG